MVSSISDMWSKINRRELIKLSARGILGTAGITLGLNTVNADSHDASRLRTISRMIKDSGEIWLNARDREHGKQSVLISFGDKDGYEVNRRAGKWIVSPRKFSRIEVAQLEQYLIKSPHLPTRIGEEVHQGVYVRAWVKNGRVPHWIMSCDHVKSQVAVRSLQRQRSVALTAKFDSDAFERKMIEIYHRNSEFRKTLRDDLIS